MLDASAHEFKTPLVTILRSCSGLPLGQFLDNAYKYSQAGTDITVSIESADESFPCGCRTAAPRFLQLNKLESLTVSIGCRGAYPGSWFGARPIRGSKDRARTRRQLGSG